MAGLYDEGPKGGLLGMFSDPRMMGLLGMAQGFAEAGAPSPYRVSTGQALSRGLMRGAKAAQGVMQINAMNQFRQAQMRKLQAEAEKQEEDKRLRQSIFGQMGFGGSGLLGQGSGMDFEG